MEVNEKGKSEVRGADLEVYGKETELSTHLHSAVWRLWRLWLAGAQIRLYKSETTQNWQEVVDDDLEEDE